VVCMEVKEVLSRSERREIDRAEMGVKACHWTHTYTPCTQCDKTEAITNTCF
jgi:hypothetical protein